MIFNRYHTDPPLIHVHRKSVQPKIANLIMAGGLDTRTTLWSVDLIGKLSAEYYLERKLWKGDF